MEEGEGGRRKEGSRMVDLFDHVLEALVVENKLDQNC